jgi:hypothetical protein
MVGLWQWFKSRGRPAVSARTAGPRSQAVAVEQVAENWAEDGDRADQDYYHVPGASNPDLKDPPALKGNPLPKTSGKKRRAKSARA